MVLTNLYCIQRLCHSFKGCSQPLPSCFMGALWNIQSQCNARNRTNHTCWICFCLLNPFLRDCIKGDFQGKGSMVLGRWCEMSLETWTGRNFHLEMCGQVGVFPSGCGQGKCLERSWSHPYQYILLLRQTLPVVYEEDSTPFTILLEPWISWGGHSLS